MSVAPKVTYLLLLLNSRCLLTSLFFLEQPEVMYLYSLQGVRRRVLGRGQLGAGQQQLSGDNRLQQQGQRWGWLEDVVGIHTCVEHMVNECTHTHTRMKLINCQLYALSHTHMRTNTHMGLSLLLQTSVQAPPAAAGTSHDSEKGKKQIRTEVSRIMICYMITSNPIPKKL